MWEAEKERKELLVCQTGLPGYILPDQTNLFFPENPSSDFLRQVLHG